jgi:hypothetical protein
MGVAFVSLHEGIDATTPAGKLAVSAATAHRWLHPRWVAAFHLHER